MADAASVACTRDIYMWIKDFLPPVAALVASASAVCVTHHFSRKQANTAKLQAEIAYDRLRYDLFEKRYTIYRDAQSLIRKVVSEREQADISTEDMNDASIDLRILDDASFFFPERICEIFASIGADIETVVTKMRARQRLNQNENAQRNAINAEINAADTRLRGRLRTMPEDFSAVMSFPLLTGND